MPTQVQNRPSLADSRVGLDKYPTTHHQPIPHDRDHAHGARFNLQHREALRLALGSILAPKRPNSSRTPSSGTASPSPAHSGTYTPTTPALPHTPSLDANNASHENSFARHHYGYPHHHPTHLPSKLGRIESHPEVPDTTVQPASTSNTPPMRPSSPPRGLSMPNLSRRSSSLSPPSSCQSPQLLPASPPISLTPSTDELDLSPSSLPPPALPLVSAESRDGSQTVTSHGHGDSLPEIVVTAHDTTLAENGELANSGNARAKFIKTLQSKRAWDALIHGSFS